MQVYTTDQARIKKPAPKPTEAEALDQYERVVLILALAFFAEIPDASPAPGDKRGPRR